MSGTRGESVKECPRCGQRLLSTYYPDLIDWRLACPDRKDCGYTEAEPTDMALRREGHATLPGF